MNSNLENASRSPDGVLELEDYLERFQNYQPWINFFTVVSALCIFFATHWVLSAINRSIAHLDGNPEIYLLPQPAMWWGCAGVLGFIFGFELTLQVWTAFHDSAVVNLYNSWIAEQPKSYKSRNVYVDTWKLFRRLALFIALPVALFTVLNLPSHASIGPQEIHECGYAFSGCETLAYSTARRMTAIRGFRTRNGDLTARAGVVVDFEDGRRWSSANWGDFKSSVDPALIDLLLRKTNLPIENADTEKDIPPQVSK